jgi:hypothetical protein
MGWWSSTIMGGDSPLDFKSSYFNSLDMDEFDTPKKIVGKTLEERQDFFIKGVRETVDRWGCGKAGEDYHNNKMSIGYQVAAVIMMENGVKIKPELKEIMLEWIPQDEWAGEDKERKGYVNNLIESLKSYDGSKEVNTTSKGLFEVFEEFRSEGKSGLINKN